MRRLEEKEIEAVAGGGCGSRIPEYDAPWCFTTYVDAPSDGGEDDEIYHFYSDTATGGTGGAGGAGGTGGTGGAGGAGGARGTGGAGPDSADEEVIVVTAPRPEIRFVGPTILASNRPSGYVPPSLQDQGFSTEPPPCPYHEGNVIDGDRSVTFTQPNGATIQNDGGSLSWRNNNPGNIRSGTFANNHGALGEADGFAVFGSYSGGLLALEALITGPSYSSLSIYDAVARYAPPVENDTGAYRESLANQTGLDLSRTIASLSSVEVGSVLAAIQRHEGWQEGTSTLLSPPQECP